MDWDSACRFRCSTTWSSNIAPTARARHLAYLSMAIFCGQCLSFMEFLPGGPASYSPAPA